MTAMGLPELLGRAVPFLTLGVVLGLVHFALLGLNVRLYLENTAVAGPVALHLLRLAGTAAAFAAIAPRGATALLAALAGFSAARFVVAHQVRRRP